MAAAEPRRDLHHRAGRRVRARPARRPAPARAERGAGGLGRGGRLGRRPCAPGYRCAVATPNAERAARGRSRRSRWKPSVTERVDRDLVARRRAPRPAPRRRATRSRALGQRRRELLGAARTSVRPRWPLRVGRLDDERRRASAAPPESSRRGAAGRRQRRTPPAARACRSPRSASGRRRADAASPSRAATSAGDAAPGRPCPARSARRRRARGRRARRPRRRTSRPARPRRAGRAAPRARRASRSQAIVVDAEPARGPQRAELRRPGTEYDERAYVGPGARRGGRRPVALRATGPPGRVLAVPGDRALEARVEADPRAEAEQPLGLVGRADVAVDLARAVVDEADHRAAACRARRTPLGDLSTAMSTPVATLIASPCSGPSAPRAPRRSRARCPRRTASRGSPSRRRAPSAAVVQRLRDEARDDLLGVLVRAVVVERPRITATGMS